MHSTGQVWCATIFELYHKLGGDSNYKHIKQNNLDITTINQKFIKDEEQPNQ
jgi:hypothetical protein